MGVEIIFSYWSKALPIEKQAPGRGLLGPPWAAPKPADPLGWLPPRWGVGRS